MYGGRGITLCDEWNSSFINFYNWANENGYKNNLTIDRIDNNDNYYPENCRWVTMKEQNRNKSNHLYITINNEKICFAEFCEKYNLDPKKERHEYIKDKNKYMKKINK